MKYKNNHPHIREGETQFEFIAVERFLVGLGFEIGTGSNRLSPTVLGCDCYPHKETDMVWDCLEKPYPFKDEVFDFVFSSHVLEDFKPDKIQDVFNEWFRLVKKGGHLVLLVPDMENKRYPDWDEKFTEDDEEVKRGERSVGSLKGNPSHFITMGEMLLYRLLMKSPFQGEVVQKDTLPHTQMTLDFVIRKL